MNINLTDMQRLYLSNHDDPNTIWMIVRTPYNKAYLDSFKQTVPWHCRLWNPEHKVWLVDRKYIGRVRNLIKKYNLLARISEAHVDTKTNESLIVDLDDLKGIPISLAMRLIEVKDAQERSATGKAQEKDPGRVV